MKERQPKIPRETFIDPMGCQWEVLPERKPFGEDSYRELRRTENGETLELKITQSWLDKLREARAIHLRQQQSPRGNRRT